MLYAALSRDMFIFIEINLNSCLQTKKPQQQYEKVIIIKMK